MANKQVYFQDWGLMDYREAWGKQEELFNKILHQKIENRTNNLDFPTNNYLIFVEHPHVYTLGKNGKSHHLLLNEEQLEKKQARYYEINRGGDITYHGPGQLVGYPILDLDNFFTDIHLYLRTLEEAVILTLQDYGIRGGRLDGFTGVWLEPDTPNARKICALGVRSSRWVTMHGFALNVNANLGYFDNIVPCGIGNKAVSSMENELGTKLNMKDVKDTLKSKLASLFNMKLV